MEDKDKKVPDDKKQLKNPTGKSLTGKPLDIIDTNPQLGVSTSGGMIKYRKESADLTAQNSVAARLISSVRKSRMESFKTRAPSNETNQDLSELFDGLKGKTSNQLIDIINDSISKFDESNDPMADRLRGMLYAALPENTYNETLLKKADKTGIPFSTLSEVYERGAASWDGSKMTQEQYAFARVNSYIAKGRAWYMDADLREEKEENLQLNSTFNEFVESLGSDEREKVQAVPRKTTKKRQDIELVGRPDSGKDALTRQGEVKRKIIEKKLGNYQNDPLKRQDATDSGVKAYKKDTPGELKKIDESFNIEFASGIGVTITAADLGIKAKGGFELHPSVIEEMEDMEEDVMSGARQAVYMPPMRKADGTFTPARTEWRRTGKKIIRSENPHDGQ